MAKVTYSKKLEMSLADLYSTIGEHIELYATDSYGTPINLTKRFILELTVGALLTLSRQYMITPGDVSKEQWDLYQSRLRKAIRWEEKHIKKDAQEGRTAQIAIDLFPVCELERLSTEAIYATREGKSQWEKETKYEEAVKYEFAAVKLLLQKIIQRENNEDLLFNQTAHYLLGVMKGRVSMLADLGIISPDTYETHNLIEEFGDF